MPPKEITELKDAIRATHGCESLHVESIPVKEVFEGQPAWLKSQTRSAPLSVIPVCARPRFPRFDDRMRGEAERWRNASASGLTAKPLKLRQRETYRVHFENWKRSARSSSVILRGRMSA